MQNSEAAPLLLCLYSLSLVLMIGEDERERTIDQGLLIYHSREGFQETTLIHVLLHAFWGKLFI